jgi:hypothetical protein
MPFFQNPFDSEFRGTLILGDNKFVLTFAVPPNKNSHDAMVAWNTEPYDFSVVTNLALNYAYDVEFKNYSPLSINVVGVVPGATTAAEVVALLNADATFADMFVASVIKFTSAGPNTVLIKAKSGRPKQMVRMYIDNAGAEQSLGFNKKAGVNEIPTYFSRHTIANRFAFPDSVGMLVELDTSDAVDQAIITEAGFDYLNPLADWQMLNGRSEVFTFRKITKDGSGRITEIIEYPAGAIEGWLAKKTLYVYSGISTTPDQITEEPYVLTTGDLVTP